MSLYSDLKGIRYRIKLASAYFKTGHMIDEKTLERATKAIKMHGRSKNVCFLIDDHHQNKRIFFVIWEMYDDHILESIRMYIVCRYLIHS